MYTKIKIKYCKKCEKIVFRNYNLTNEFKSLKGGGLVHPESFKYNEDILLFCKCGWLNERHYKTIEFEVDEEELVELKKGENDILIKKYIMLSNLNEE